MTRVTILSLERHILTCEETLEEETEGISLMSRKNGRDLSAASFSFARLKKKAER